ncbi:hypothetical protein QQF64_035839 [Cirrhinus molitorella]|uniref:Uncharacterized protein n=1 Tax=Cirrhinus molitorella TaxID=172907 RepID=A0ABR3NHM3_9TELE
MKANQPPSKRARQDRECSAAVASDYDADSSASAVNLSPPSRSSTPQQENDSIDEACEYIKIYFKIRRPGMSLPEDTFCPVLLNCLKKSGVGCLCCANRLLFNKNRRPILKLGAICSAFRSLVLLVAEM